MATNYKRKTPCASVRRGWTPATVSYYCTCCGEWEMRNGKFRRYVERMVSR